jgi:hypothetical protein
VREIGAKCPVAALSHPWRQLPQADCQLTWDEILPASLPRACTYCQPEQKQIGQRELSDFSTPAKVFQLSLPFGLANERLNYRKIESQTNCDPNPAITTSPK